MAKDVIGGSETIAPATPVIQAQPTVGKVQTWTFQKIGKPERTFDVDIERLQTFVNRADLKYIGTVPLPPNIQLRAKK